MNTFFPTPDASQSSAWFYADSNNTPQGPFPFADLKRFAGERIVSPETLVIAVGGNEWMPFERLVPPEPKGSLVEARWVVIFFLLTMWPVGLVMLWQSNRFQRRTKEIISWITGVPVLLMLAALAGPPGILGTVVVLLFVIWKKLQISVRIKGVATAGVVAFAAMMLNVEFEQAGAPPVSTYSPPPSVAPVAVENEKPKEIAPRTPAPVQTRPVEESVAYKLASLNAGYRLSANEHVVREYQAILQKLSSLTGLNEEMISSQAWMATKELRGRGVQVPTLVLLKDTFVTLSSAPEGHTFEAVLAAVTILKFSESRGR